MSLRLGVNIDHVATVRNARGGAFPDPARAARLVSRAGADGITIHLREDRRHIRDADLPAIKAATSLPINLEMAATDEMVAIAVDYRPHSVCLVPEKRAEITTEGGLDVCRHQDTLAACVAELHAANILVSLFIEADPAQIKAAKAIAADIVELHTGAYCTHTGAARQQELQRIQRAATLAASLGLVVDAGHGLCFDTVHDIAAIPEITTLNIGHFLIGEAIFVGLDAAVAEMRQRMYSARA
jgi:pyridoxine 5-phosphate synthase